ncbi:MAG: hypothetical protein OSA89_19815, partial [Mariniblastus sp.]|nr:hypothetical protein [Mariniblastus sp.]
VGNHDRVDTECVVEFQLGDDLPVFNGVHAAARLDKDSFVLPNVTTLHHGKLPVGKDGIHFNAEG